MERRSGLSRSEAALERLLQRIDDAIDEYARTRRSRHDPIARPRCDEPPLDDDDDRLDRDWAAWWALPLAIRDWLLWYVPGWWALAPGPFRRFLLITARLIVRNGLAPRIALRRAAAQLHLPPPRRTTRLTRTTSDRAARQFRTTAIRARRERTRRLARWRAARAASRAPIGQRRPAMPRARRLSRPEASRPAAARRRAPMPRRTALRTRWR
jgi:hypothetical protein